MPLWVRLLLCLCLLVPLHAQAGVYISAVLPNTTDDASLEYIEFRNTGCDVVDISSWTITDASPKTYVFPSGTMIASKNALVLSRPVSKIILNNENESLTLKSNTGVGIVDTYSYTASTKGQVITRTLIDDLCDVSPPSGSGASDIGVSQSGNIDTGTTDPGGGMSGATESGSIDTITTCSGVTQTGVTESGSMTQTGDTDTGVTISDSINMSGSIDANSGSTVLSGATSSTGNISDSRSSPQLVWSGVLAPLSLSYSDIDLDGYIDTLILNYPADLTGTINTGSILLYSSTGGLYATRANTATGYILSGSLSGSTVILSIIESTIHKSTLKINATTSSELRLKSTGDIGVRAGSGIASEPLFLTSSFGEYKNIIHPTLALPTAPDTSTMPGGGSGTQVATGVVTMTGITFPEILLTAQQYTNTLFSGSSIICTTLPCRMNVTLEPIFTPPYRLSDYLCEVIYGTGSYDCNPPQLYPTPGSKLSVKLTHRASGLASERAWEIIQSIASPDLVTPEKNNDTNPPIVRLKYDGKLKSYHEPLGDLEMNCYTMTCAINLTGEDSYDPEDGDVRFLWIFDRDHIKTSKDPGEFKYPMGDHYVELQVIDKVGNMSMVRYIVHVLGEREKPAKEVKKKEKLEKPVKEKKAKKVKKKKMRPMQLFSPPEIVLQKSKFTTTDTGYRCLTSTKSCSLNLTLTGTLKGIVYTWNYSDGTSVIGKNPKSKKYVPGRYWIEVTAGYKDMEPLWRQKIDVVVIKEKKPKKKKKAKKSKKAPKQKPVKPEKPKIQSIEASEASVNPLIFVALFGGISPLTLLRKRRRK